MYIDEGYCGAVVIKTVNWLHYLNNEGVDPSLSVVN